MLAELIVRIVAEEGAENRKDGPWRPRCSSAGSERCIRQDVYRALGFPTKRLPGRTLLIFDDGEWAEETTLDLVRRTIFKVHSQQLGLDVFTIDGSHVGYTCGDCDQRVGPGVVHGHIDALITDPLGVDYLLEHKTSNRFTFQRWANGDDIPWDYVTQAVLYVHALRKLGSNVDRAILLIKCKDTAAFLEYVIWCPDRLDPEPPTVIEAALVMESDHPTDIPLPEELRRKPTVIGTAIERFREIVRHRDAKSLPARPLPFNHWRCTYCSFEGACWDGYQATAESDVEKPPITLTGDLLALARDTILSADKARESKKQTEDLKEKLEVAIVSLGAHIGTGEIDGRTIDVKIKFMERDGLDTDKIPEAVKKAAHKVTQFTQVEAKFRDAKRARKPKEKEPA